LAWDGDPRVTPRTQSGLAVSADGENWILINASPDLRQQILAAPVLQPKQDGRHSPIIGVVLTNGDVDHVAGLLTLRERQPLDLFAAEPTLSLLRQNPIFGVLDREMVRERRVDFDTEVEVVEGLTVCLFPVPGKVPLYMENAALRIGEATGDVVGLEFRCGGRRFVHMPNCARVTPEVRERAEGADLLMFDGTTFTDDEMPRLGLSRKTASRMGHIAMDGPEGSLAALTGVSVGAKVYTHINNTNAVLIDGSPERRAVEAAGWRLAHDGMEIAL
jgi:pyrroloquinoline quinone biosynthesis protein B